MAFFRRKEEPQAAEHFAELDRLGFFAYVEESECDTVKAAARLRPSRSLFDERTKRFFFADAENLAEGGVAEFLRELEPQLRRLGVPPLALAEELDADESDDYAVVVNGERYVVYSESELAGESGGHSWGLASARVLRIVNDLLTAAGSSERAWAYMGGNELAVWILTHELRDAVAAIVADVREEPYAMTEEPPCYGQRHGRER